MDVEKVYLSWGSVETLVQSICFQLEHEKWTPTIIVGITRGGLTPAALLSHRLNISMCSLDVSLRDNNLFEPTSSRLPEEIANGHTILIVDDINDSGDTQEWIKTDWMRTFQFAHSEWPKDLIKFAALIYNGPSKEVSDFYGEMIDKERNPSWICFPWETWWEK